MSILIWILVFSFLYLLIGLGAARLMYAIIDKKIRTYKEKVRFKKIKTVAAGIFWPFILIIWPITKGALWGILESISLLWMTYEELILPLRRKNKRAPSCSA